MKIDLDAKRRDELGRTVRLWLLGLPCAAVGAYMVSRTGRLFPGIAAFLVALVVLGPILWAYERRRARRGQR